MADLRSRFIEDYAGGLLNVSRQEFSTSGEVASQDGLATDGGTLFVEDGTGTKSGLKLGAGLAEVVDPTTETSCVNVRFADKTYSKLRDLKLFTTAIASAQAALSEAASTSITNLETTLELLETDITSLQQSIQTDVYDTRNRLEDLVTTTDEIKGKVFTLEKADIGFTSDINKINITVADIKSAAVELELRVSDLEKADTDLQTTLNTINSAISDLSSRITALENP